MTAPTNLPVLNFFRKGNRTHVADHDFGFEGEDIRVVITKRAGIGYDVRVVRVATQFEEDAQPHPCYARFSTARGLARRLVADYRQELVAGTQYEGARS